MMDIEWRAVVGYEGTYEVSNTGLVRSLDRIVSGRWGLVPYKGKQLKPSTNSKGYLQVMLSKGGKSKTYKVHRLVAISFLPNPLSKPQVNHLDGDPSNNLVSNLEWSTCSENIKHSFEKLGKSYKGDKHPNKKLTSTKVEEIRRRYDEGGITFKELAATYGVHPSTIKHAYYKLHWG